MQAQLGKGGTGGLKRRIKNYEVKTMDPEWMDEANELLKDVNLEEVKKISDGSAIFYSWVCHTQLYVNNYTNSIIDSFFYF